MNHGLIIIIIHLRDFKKRDRNFSKSLFLQLQLQTWFVTLRCFRTWEVNGPSIKLHEAKTSRSMSVYSINQWPAHSQVSKLWQVTAITTFLLSNVPSRLLPFSALRMGAAYWVHWLGRSQRTTRDKLLFSVLMAGAKHPQLSALILFALQAQGKHAIMYYNIFFTEGDKT